MARSNLTTAKALDPNADLRAQVETAELEVRLAEARLRTYNAKRALKTARETVSADQAS